MCPLLCVQFLNNVLYRNFWLVSQFRNSLYISNTSQMILQCLFDCSSFICSFFFLFICSFVCLFFVYLFVCFFVNLVCDFVCLFMIWSQQQNSYQLIQSRPQIQLKNILGKAIRDKWENPENDHLSFRSSQRPTNQLEAMIVQPRTRLR